MIRHIRFLTILLLVYVAEERTINWISLDIIFEFTFVETLRWLLDNFVRSVGRFNVNVIKLIFRRLQFRINTFIRWIDMNAVFFLLHNDVENLENRQQQASTSVVNDRENLSFFFFFKVALFKKKSSVKFSGKIGNKMASRTSWRERTHFYI